MEYKHEQLTGTIIHAFFDVYNELGYGFLERVYEQSMAIELRSLGLHVESQKSIKVNYRGYEVGNYFADLLVNDTVILELKAAEGIAPEHEAQLINYLKATNIEVGLLLNFGLKPQIVRKAFDNTRKKLRPTIAAGGSLSA